MTKLLQTMIEKLDQLPDDVQDRYVTQFLAELTRENAMHVEEISESQLKPPQETGGFEYRAGLGGGKGLILYMADDFDATPEEFEEYI